MIIDWTCKDCGKDCELDKRDYYGVKNDLWAKFGVGKGMLCVDCFEKRIGHKLTKDEIDPCWISTDFNPYTASILNS